jgi:hypothetical protein
MATKLSPALRVADKGDAPAIISLLLTSFRTIPLFALLYAPLQLNKDNAFDTVYFWSRRVHLAIADPSSDVLVAELPITYLDNVPEWRNSDGGGNNASWQMFEWVQRRARLEQTRLKSGTVVVRVCDMAVAWHKQNWGRQGTSFEHHSSFSM